MYAIGDAVEAVCAITEETDDGPMALAAAGESGVILDVLEDDWLMVGFRAGAAQCDVSEVSLLVLATTAVSENSASL